MARSHAKRNEGLLILPIRYLWRPLFVGLWLQQAHVVFNGVRYARIWAKNNSVGVREKKNEKRIIMLRFITAFSFVNARIAATTQFNVQPLAADVAAHERYVFLPTPSSSRPNAAARCWFKSVE